MVSMLDEDQDNIIVYHSIYEYKVRVGLSQL